MLLLPLALVTVVENEGEIDKAHYQYERIHLHLKEADRDEELTSKPRLHGLAFSLFADVIEKRFDGDL